MIYHFTGELSNHIDCNNLVGPIRLYVIFSLTPVNVSDEDISEFFEENENKNTVRKTSQDVACNM